MKILIGLSLILCLLVVACAPVATEEIKDSPDIEEPVGGEAQEETTEPTITQDDLDKLKQEIESIETDDLGGLSE